ncbi:MAG TPA: cytochrome C oxidase subunit IV family protein [bacterium]|nr:cytochrome C oxidase subunit IV family protein [bacterium]
MSAEHNAHALEHEHPGPLTYAKVAAVLTILTAMEVWVFYLPAVRSMLVPILIVLSGTKFTLVVMFYMHLKYDHGAFSRVLIGGVFIAFGIFLWILALFTYSLPIPLSIS